MRRSDLLIPINVLAGDAMPASTRREFLGTAAAALAGASLPAVARTASADTAKVAAPLDEFAALDALAQAELVRKKQVTPLELVNAAIVRVEKLDPQLNSVVSAPSTRCAQCAAEPAGDGPFAGVPFLVKDLEQLKAHG